MGKTRARNRRVVVYDASVPEGERAQAVVPYFDAAFEGEGRGTYWVPVLVRGPFKARRLRKIARAVADGIASEHAQRMGLPPTP